MKIQRKYCYLHNYNTNFIDLVADISLFSKHELLKYLKLLKVRLQCLVALL